jgi:hypothetical protein
MLGLRLATDCTPRTKNGHPAQSTIGIDSTSSTQLWVCMSMSCRRCPAMASAVTTTVKGNVHQKRRRKSTSSGLSLSSRLGISGSSAMPHFGQAPGWSWRTSGCIGHV